MKFRKRPVVVEANQLTKRGCCPLGVQTEESGRHYVTTIHGDRITVVEGDWIIQELDGIHYYPCKPEIFAATYEPEESIEPMTVSERARKLVGDMPWITRALSNEQIADLRAQIQASMEAAIDQEKEWV